MATFTRTMFSLLGVLILLFILLQLAQYRDEMHSLRARGLEERVAALEKILAEQAFRSNNIPRQQAIAEPDPRFQPVPLPPQQPAPQQPAPEQPGTPPPPPPPEQQPNTPPPPPTGHPFSQQPNLPSAKVDPGSSLPGFGFTMYEQAGDSKGAPAAVDPNNFDTWRTRWRCYRRGDFTDICAYENLCFDGNHLIFLNPQLDDHTDMHAHPLHGPEKSTRFDWVYWEPAPNPPPMSQYVPFMSTFSNDHQDVYVVKPSSLQKHVDTLELMDKSVYFGAFDMNPNNIWYASMQAFNIWDAQVLNRSLADADKLPPIDHVLLRRSFMYPGWEREVNRAIAQPHTEFLMRPWYLNSSFPLERLSGAEAIPLDYREREPYLTEAEKRNFSPPQRKHHDVSLSEKNMICTPRAVVVGQKPNLFSGVEPAVSFRTKIFKQLGLEEPPLKGILQQSNDRETPKHLSYKVVIDRRGRGRSRDINNIEEVKELCEYYGLEPVVLQSFPDSTPVTEQIAELSQADIYIIAHGAGITNAMFMSPRSSLIEVFPYGSRATMHRQPIDALGVNHMPLISWIKGPLGDDHCGGELYTTEYYEKCQRSSNIEHQLNTCVTWSKNACVVVPIDSLEDALLSAYDFLGVTLATRVERRFSELRDVRTNNYHHKDNFLWTPDPWHVEADYTREFAWDRVEGW